MKKKKILIATIFAASFFSLTACGGDSTAPTTTTTTTEVVNTKCTVKFESNGGTSVNNVTLEKGEKVTEPQNMAKKDSENRDCEFKGWYTDAKFKNKYDFNTPVNADLTLYAKWYGYEDVTYTLIPEKLDSGIVTGKQVGIFNIISGEVRGRTKPWEDPNDSTNTKEWTKSVKSGRFEFTAPGDGKVIVYVQNSSGNATTQKLTVSSPMETQTFTFSGSTAVAPYPGGSPVVAIEAEIEEGLKYTIGSPGTSDFFELDVICNVKESDINGFTIDSTGDTDYLIGESFDKSRLSLYATYENGKLAPIANDDEDISFDLTGFDSTSSGVSKIKVKYMNFDAIEYDVNVWEVDSLTLGFNSTYKSDVKTQANNLQYINGKVKKVYKVNENLSTEYLSVIANAKLGDKTKEFLVDTREAMKFVSYGTIDTSTEGVKEVTVKYNDGKTVSTSYNVTVVNPTPVKDANNNYIVRVDQSYTGVAGAGDATLGNQFKTIGEALEYLELCNLDKDSKKIMTIASGTYNEKLEINVPNLTINGVNKENTIIEWDSLWGIPDEGGFVQVTDSVQTVAVRESAVNCTFNNITLSNWWNSETRFNSKLELLKKYGLYTTKVNEHRALALLVQSDKFTMNNCKLLGYQDTVEFFKGRQYLHNCYIAGCTDFIFGTNNTTLFYECEIHAIYNANVSGGYTTAFMGCSQGESDYVDYGAIFYKCNFTADSEVTASDTSLGRTWGAYAQVAYIECVMGAHISKAKSTGASSKERYVAMQGYTPMTSTVRFVEYGNTGTGAISASQDGVTYLTSTEAAKYHNISIIFGQTNGKVTYSDSWNVELD